MSFNDICRNAKLNETASREKRQKCQSELETVFLLVGERSRNTKRRHKNSLA